MYWIDLLRYLKWWVGGDRGSNAKYEPCKLINHASCCEMQHTKGSPSCLHIFLDVVNVIFYLVQFVINFLQN